MVYADIEKKRAYARSYARMLRARRLANGICVSCSKASLTGKQQCQTCLDRAAQYTEKHRAKKQAAGLCIGCGKAPPLLTSLCKDCLLAARKANWFQYALNAHGGYRIHILERDGFQCRVCSRDYDLCIHHIDGNGVSSKSPNDSQDNLITLCRGCHFHIERLLQVVKYPEVISSLVHRTTPILHRENITV